MFGVIGINYISAPLAVRDRVSFTDSGKIEFMNIAAESGVQQLMVISTCNRCQVCCYGEGSEEIIRELFIRHFGQEVVPYVQEYRDAEALEYLFRMAAGLESMIIGEDQILTQVYEAWALSRTVGCSGKELNRIVQDALACAKKIKTELKISEVPLSVAYIGIKLLEERLGIKGRKILVIGSGKTAALALRYIRDLGGEEVTACSRNYSHAEYLKNEFPGINVIPFADRYKQIGNSDIVISATSAPHPVVRADKVVTSGNLLFLDLAAPRDIETAVGDIVGVDLINLDVLNETASKNLSERERLSSESYHIISQASADTVRWLESASVDGTIRSLHELCDEITSDSYDYLTRRIDLSGRDKKILKKVLSASLLRLIREPVKELKSSCKEDQDEYSKLVGKLFGFHEKGKL